MLFNRFAQNLMLIATRVLMLLLLTFLFLSTRLKAQEATSTGVSTPQLLYGVLDAGARKFRFALRITAGTEGDVQGELLSMDEGGRRFKLDNLRNTDDVFEFAITLSSAKYAAQFDTTQNAFVGKWKQAGQEFDLKFQRVNEIPQQTYQAVWTGQINAILQKLDVRFRELQSGEVFFDSLTQKAGGLVAKKTVDGQQVTFDVVAIPGDAEFEGILNDEGNVLTGKWKQGLIPLGLVLKKQDLPIEEPGFGDTAGTTPNRPQTPQPPFPYAASDVVFANETAGLSLAATLTVPQGEGPFPAVVLISGSGPQDRDESILGHKPFWVIADHFSRPGVAVLRFDDRGVAKSEGDFAKADSQDFATDVAAAVVFLLEHANIDSTKIGLCGHSEGGIIAPLVASQNPDINFIILLAGPGVNGEKILISQSRLILEASGFSADDLDRQGGIQRVLLSLAKQKPQPSREEFVKQAQQALKPIIEGSDITEEAAKAMAEAAATQLVGPWFRYFLNYEPGPVLEKLECSVLALVGEKDLQVDPQLNIPALVAALEKAPTDDFTVKELPGLNHLFQQCKTGLVSEYAEIEQTFSPNALQLMTDWILERVR